MEPAGVRDLTCSLTPAEAGSGAPRVRKPVPGPTAAHSQPPPHPPGILRAEEERSGHLSPGIAARRLRSGRGQTLAFRKCARAAFLGKSVARAQKVRGGRAGKERDGT